MKTLKILARLTCFGLVLIIGVVAQPGRTCVFDYNPFEIRELGYIYYVDASEANYSSDVFEERINSRHIFIGKIVSQESGKIVKTERLSEDFFTPIKVKVIKEIAGKLNKKTIDLSIQTNCRRAVGSPEIGGEYIFFVNQINTESFKGLVSSKWSAALDGIPKSELDEITNKIRDYRNGVKQPAVGYLIKHKPNPFRDYVNRYSNREQIWRDPKYKNDWRIKKWKYDPKYAEPLVGVKIIIKNEDGAEIAATKTDSSGRFEFANLPKTRFSTYYIFYPDVPKTYLSVGGSGILVSESGMVYGGTIRLDVAPAGKIEAEIGLEQGSWKDTASVHDISLIGANSKTNEVYQDYQVRIPVERYWEFDKKLTIAADKVMAGEYVLKIGTSSTRSSIYYPGVGDVKKAKIIEIKEGETTKIDFSISSLKDQSD